MKLLLFLSIISHFSINNVLSLEKKEFLSTKYNKVNMRIGPGKSYEVSQQFLAVGVPLLVISSFDNWKEIKDFRGSTGWVSKTQLSSKRFGIITQKKVNIKVFPKENSKIKYRLHTNVIFKILRCKKSWCKIGLDNGTGWVLKKNFWGTDIDEKF